MNFAMNGTMFNPFMNNNMMYGGNFVDVLFRHLMEHGWEGLSLMMILQFYMYLSLDRIKEFFKYLTDNLTIQIKTGLNTYSTFCINYAKIIALKLFDRIKSFKFDNKTKKNESFVTAPSKNCISLGLNCENKIDLMALGSFLLQNKEVLGLKNYCRKLSDKYKTLEIYVLPQTMILEYNFIRTQSLDKNYDEITIKILQNIEYTLYCETDNKIDILKDVIIKKIDTSEKKMSNDEFYAYAKKTLPAPISGFPEFPYKNYYYCPGNICDTSAMAGIFLYIYYTKNFVLFKSLCNFLSRGEIFHFDGTRFLLTSKINLAAINDETKMNNFITELEKYIDEKLIPYCNKKYEKMAEWIQTNKKLFDTVIVQVPGITLEFESAIVSDKDLMNYSRYFFNELVKLYYSESEKNKNIIGNKISINQLHIKYNIEKRKQENPAYDLWKKTYANEPEEEHPAKTVGANRDAKNPDADKMTNSSTSSIALVQPATCGQGSIKNMLSDLDDSHFFMKNRYRPPKPQETIEVDVMIPVAESVFIKTDKKPFEHLYLKKEQKESLESYLFNFKNNKDLYEKMGITYKGGIALMGDPGCGKSSTILAIATYLGKDIYYLDLGRLKTNQELQLCIDYIKTNSQRGGVVIFEDVDCMTDIVKRRADPKNIESSINKLKIAKEMKQDDAQNEKLSLSYLLNVLDGTLAPEDIIFIMTTNHIEQLDPALIRPGRIDLTIKIDKCEKYQLQQIYQDLYGRQLSIDVVDRFREYEFITAEVIMHLFHNVYNKSISAENLLKKFLK